MRSKSILVFAVVFLTAVLALCECASGYFAFTNIADTIGTFDNIGLARGFNDSGTVAFSAGYTGGGAIYTGDGGPLTTIVTTATTGGMYSGENGHSMNNDGTVVFAGGHGLHTGNGGEISTLFYNPVATGIYGAIGPIINDNGTVAFRAILDGTPGGFIGKISGGQITTIADNTGVYTQFDIPSMNNNGTLAFVGSIGDWDPGGQYLLTGNGGPLTVITNSSDDFYSLSNDVSINDAGIVAFVASPDPETRGIYTASDGVVTALADTSGDFAGFQYPSINNDGTIAFGGSLDTGGLGIFTGADPINDKVIYLGDNLFGSTVTRVGFWGDGLNNVGQIAFRYELATGIQGIAVATENGIAELLANAGGPYLLDQQPIMLQGSVVGDYSEAAWDLDADGFFDDFYGLEPTVTAAMVETWGFSRGMTWDIGFQVTGQYGGMDTSMTELTFVPAPAAVLLGSIGLSFSGWMLRRKASH